MLPAKCPATLERKKLRSELIFSVLHIPQEYMLHYLWKEIRHQSLD